MQSNIQRTILDIPCIIVYGSVLVTAVVVGIMFSGSTNSPEHKISEILLEGFSSLCALTNQSPVCSRWFNLHILCVAVLLSTSVICSLATWFTITNPNSELQAANLSLLLCDIKQELPQDHCDCPAVNCGRFFFFFLSSPLLKGWTCSKMFGRVQGAVVKMNWSHWGVCGSVVGRANKRDFSRQLRAHCLFSMAAKTILKKEKVVLCAKLAGTVQLASVCVGVCD